MTTTITKEQAESLAVNYNAFVEASRDKDALGRRVWAKGLKTIQQEIGVIMVDDKRLNFWINQAS